MLALNDDVIVIAYVINILAIQCFFRQFQSVTVFRTRVKSDNVISVQRNENKTENKR